MDHKATLEGIKNDTSLSIISNLYSGLLLKSQVSLSSPTQWGGDNPLALFSFGGHKTLHTYSISLIFRTQQFEIKNFFSGVDVKNSWSKKQNTFQDKTISPPYCVGRHYNFLLFSFVFVLFLDGGGGGGQRAARIFFGERGKTLTK